MRVLIVIVAFLLNCVPISAATWGSDGFFLSAGGTVGSKGKGGEISYGYTYVYYMGLYADIINTDDGVRSSIGLELPFIDGGLLYNKQKVGGCLRFYLPLGIPNKRYDTAYLAMPFVRFNFIHGASEAEAGIMFKIAVPLGK